MSDWHVYWYYRVNFGCSFIAKYALCLSSRFRLFLAIYLVLIFNLFFLSILKFLFQFLLLKNAFINFLSFVDKNIFQIQFFSFLFIIFLFLLINNLFQFIIFLDFIRYLLSLLFNILFRPNNFILSNIVCQKFMINLLSPKFIFPS